MSTLRARPFLGVVNAPSTTGMAATPGNARRPFQAANLEDLAATALLDLEPQLRRIKNYEAQQALHQYVEKGKKSAA